MLCPAFIFYFINSLIGKQALQVGVSVHSLHSYLVKFLLKFNYLEQKYSHRFCSSGKLIQIKQHVVKNKGDVVCLLCHECLAKI